VELVTTALCMIDKCGGHDCRCGQNADAKKSRLLFHSSSFLSGERCRSGVLLSVAWNAWFGSVYPFLSRSGWQHPGEDDRHKQPDNHSYDEGRDHGLAWRKLQRRNQATGNATCHTTGYTAYKMAWPFLCSYCHSFFDKAEREAKRCP